MTDQIKGTDQSQGSPPPASPQREDLPQPAVRSSRGGLALIWLVPALAAVVGISLLVHSWLQSGPSIEITFNAAEGLDAGKTQVKYKNVVIGKVDKIRLSKNRSHVVVRVALDKSAESFATKGTRYWVVRPRIGLGGVSGVDTLLSGPFIGADVSESKDEQTRFSGLETPPSVTHGTPGRTFILHSRDLGSLDVGSPVYFRRIQVGRVSSYTLDPDGKGVTVKIFVDGPNDKFVHQATRFWNASGLDVALGANGLKVNTQSLATVIAGGVAFEDARGPHSGSPAAENASFDLFDDRATAMAPPDGKPQYFRMRFNQSLRGLAVDAPVEFLGFNLGKVVSISMDYDEKTKRFPVTVGALIYPDRLGKAHDKLLKLAGGDSEADMAPVLGMLVQHGLRAQARTGNLLTGQLYIALDFLPKAPKATLDIYAKPLEIPTAAGSFDKLQEQLGDIVDSVHEIPFGSIGKNLDKTLGNLNKTLDEINGQTLPAFSGTLKDVRKTLGTADSALSSHSPLQQSLTGTLGQLERMARSLRVLSDYLGTHPEALIRGRKDTPLPPSSQPAARPPPTTSRQGAKP